MRHRSLPSRIAAVALLAVGAVAGIARGADFQIYTHPHFTGAEITLKGETPDLSGLQHFHDQAASLVVTGRWQVCTEPGFRGECVVLGPGRYPTLGAPIYKRIASVRPMGAAVAEAERQRAQERSAYEEARREHVAREEVRAPRRYGRAMLDLFPDPEFRGPPVRFERDVERMGRRSDSASSMVVYEGVWELCSGPGFTGRCRVYEPGRYAHLGGLDDRVSSLRRIG